MRCIRLLPLILLTFLGAAACGDSEEPVDWDAFPSHDDRMLGAPLENVASFSNTDDISWVYILRLLAKAEIPVYAAGSLATSVKVASTDADEARRILAQEAGLRDFVLIHGVDNIAVGRGKQFHEREWEHSQDIMKPVEEVLRVNGPQTDIGKIVRKALAGYAKKPPPDAVVGRIQWSRRPFVTESLRPTTALEAVVTFDWRDGPAELDAAIIPG